MARKKKETIDETQIMKINIDDLPVDVRNKLLKPMTHPSDDESIACNDECCEVDNAEDDEISFVTTRKVFDYVGYKCPHCGNESQLALRKFEKHMYQEHNCPNCRKSFTAKLIFDPRIVIFVEVKND